MKSGTAMYWVGVAGAFVLGWLAMSITGSQRIALRTLKPDLRHVEESPGTLQLNDWSASDRQMLQGEALESAIKDIATLASETSHEDSRYTKQLYEFASRIPAKEFGRVLDQLRKPGNKQREQLRAELLGYWMELNAPAARAYLTALPTRERTRLIGPVADAWARMDSEGLMSWLRNLPSHERQAVRQAVRASVAEVLSQRDPAMAVSLLLESPDGDNGESVQVELTIFSLWAKREPVAAAERALRVAGRAGQITGLHIVMREWIKTDPAAAMAWVREIPDPERARQAGIAVASRLMESDPESAVKFAVEQGVADNKGLLQNAGKGWVERDSEGALTWAQSLPAGPARDATLAGMLSNLAAIEPQKAAQFFEAEAALGANIGAAASSILAGLVKAGDAKLLASIFTHVREADWSDIAGRATGELVDDVAPGEILTAGLQLPPGTARESWLENGIHFITLRRGLQQTRQVLESLPAGSDRTSLMGKAVLHEFVFRREIEAAVALAQTLPNGREYIMQGVTGWLKSDDATAAQTWLRQTRALTAEEKQQLLRPVAAVTATAPSGANARPTPKTTIPRP